MYTTKSKRLLQLQNTNARFSLKELHVMDSSVSLMLLEFLVLNEFYQKPTWIGWSLPLTHIDDNKNKPDKCHSYQLQQKGAITLHYTHQGIIEAHMHKNVSNVCIPPLFVLKSFLLFWND